MVSTRFGPFVAAVVQGCLCTFATKAIHTQQATRSMLHAHLDIPALVCWKPRPIQTTVHAQ